MTKNIFVNKMIFLNYNNNCNNDNNNNNNNNNNNKNNNLPTGLLISLMGASTRA